jgi:phage terminase large subunit
MDTLQAARGNVARWRREPINFVREQFGTEPDEWQADALASLGGDFDPRRCICAKACTGPGKTAFLAWAGWHRMACFAELGEHPKGAALSITRDNLKDNLWPELAKWQARSPFLAAAFTWTKEQIYANDHPQTWFLSARSFSADADAEAIGRALSGLHSRFPFILLDETGAMPAQVGRIAMQIFTGNPKDALVAQAGNPTDQTGLLYESCHSGRWRVITVTADPDDPKRTPRVSIEHAREMIKLYGRDDPWVQATILGIFPSTGFNALFGAEDVDAAMERSYKPDDYMYAPVILGGDVAREGDDQSSLARRQGIMAFPFKNYRIPDTVLLGQQFGLEVKEHNADAIFIDNTGGFGAGVIDSMRMFGFDPIPVHYAAKASSPRYLNKRAEMYFELSRWLKNGGALPKNPRLRRELLATTYTFKGESAKIIEKNFIKAILKHSPDDSDALAQTFSYHVEKRNPFKTTTARKDYDPYSLRN